MNIAVSGPSRGRNCPARCRKSPARTQNKTRIRSQPSSRKPRTKINVRGLMNAIQPVSANVLFNYRGNSCEATDGTRCLDKNLTDRFFELLLWAPAKARRRSKKKKLTRIETTLGDWRQRRSSSHALADSGANALVASTQFSRNRVLNDGASSTHPH